MGGFMHGKVVDMLYFPMKYIEMPEWLGGETWLFFSPIFNVADAAITSGVLSILLFQRRFFRDGFIEEKPEPHAEILAEIDNLPTAETVTEQGEPEVEQSIEEAAQAVEKIEKSTAERSIKPDSELGRPLL
jgi:signal peptidase II